MEGESKKIIELLRKRASGLVDNYMRNIHSCVVELEEAIGNIRSLLRSTYSVKYAKAGETKQLHVACDRIMDSYYRFRERLEKFSKDDLGSVGVKVSPSFKGKNQILRQSRGASVHNEAALFKRETSKGQVSCPIDSYAYPYEGECDSVEVEFMGEKSFKYETTFDELVDDIESSVQSVLHIYFEALDMRLPV